MIENQRLIRLDEVLLFELLEKGSDILIIDILINFIIVDINILIDHLIIYYIQTFPGIVVENCCLL